MQLKKISLLLIATILMLAACSDDDDPTPAERIAKTWRVARAFVDGTEDVSTDYSNYSFTFTTNGTYSFNNPNTENGNWELNSSETEVILNAGTANERRLAIIELTDNSLIIEDTIPATFKDAEKTIRYELTL